MVKTPRTRHSNTERDPVTIELGPDEVSRMAPEDDARPPEGEPSDAEASADAAKEDIGASEAAAEPSAETASDATTAGEMPPEEPTPEPDTIFAEEPKPAGSQAADDKAAEQPRPFAGPGPQVAPPRSPRGSAVAAGLAGGLIALVVGGLLQFAGVLGAPGPGSGAVETDIAALKSEIEGLKAGASSAGEVSGRVDGLSQALDQVKSDVASLRQAVEAGGAGNADLAALDDKIAGIESRIAAIGPGPEGPTQEEVAAINDRIAGVEALAKAAGEAGSAVDSRLGALEQSVAALTAKVDSQAQQPKIALAIAASALKAAIERGAPFQPEIETFAAIAPEAPGLADLRVHAEKGVATRADIIAETDEAANAMVAAAKPPTENADFFERLLSSAESLVTVRPIGAVEGPGAPETVARMEVALQEGDLAKAIAEFDTLPEPAKAAGAVFADKIRARLAVEQLADQAIAAAMQAP